MGRIKNSHNRPATAVRALIKQVIQMAAPLRNLPESQGELLGHSGQPYPTTGMTSVGQILPVEIQNGRRSCDVM